jgi:hypothetical protein
MPSICETACIWGEIMEYMWICEEGDLKEKGQ